MRTTPEETERTNRLILETATHMFAEKGYANVNMQDIAARLGTSKGPLYYRYKTKAALFEAALRQGVQDQLAEYRRIFGQEGPFEDVVRGALVFSAQTHTVDQFSLSELTSQAGSDASDRLEEATRIMQSYMDEFLQILKEFIEKAIARGELKPDTDPQQVIVYMMVVARGLYSTLHQTIVITSREQIDACIEDAICLLRMRYEVSEGDRITG